MAWDVELVLPFPPSVNTYWRHVGARVLVSAGGRAYRRAVAALLLLARARTLEGDLEVDVGLHPPDRRRRDVDNSLKALLDAAMAGGLYADDAQISRLTVERLAVVPGGRAVLRVRRREAQP